MIVEFTNPLFLILIPVLFLFLFIKRSKNNLYNIIRSILIVLIVLSIAGISLSIETKDTTTIFLIDKSSSMLGSENILETFVTESISNKKDYDKVGIISFGKDSMIEYSPSKILENVDFTADVNTRYTNLEDAFNLALALSGEENKNRIVLISDGIENLGDVLKKTTAIRKKNIELQVYDFEVKQYAEVQINKIKLPSRVFSNQQFDIESEIWSNISTKGIMRVFSNSVEIGKKNISISQGINRYVFTDILLNTGIEKYTVKIEVESDTNSLNNTYMAFTEVLGAPRVLLIDNENSDGEELKKIVMSMDIDVDYKLDREVYLELSDLLRYKAVIMTNISLENLKPGFDNILKTYVKDFGGGLVVTGGEESFALGGYYKTELEEILPLNMELKRDGIVPSVAIMIIIDKSGSMGSDQSGINKLEVAKEAAIRAIDTMKPTDKIGIITFNDKIQLVSEPLGYENKDELKNKISSINIGGGTTILPALILGNEELKKIESNVKHIILLTDGQAERNGYDNVLRELNINNISVSTIAVGDGADTTLLKRIADEGNGRYYYVTNYDTMPSIFTKETLMASKMYLNNEDFYPKLVNYDTIIEPILNSTPILKGYIGSSIKPGATLILKSDKDDPILAVWRYGLGKSLAFTSDVNGGWSKNYLTSPNGLEFIKNMVRTVIPLDKNNKFEMIYERIGDEIYVTVIEENKENTNKLLEAKIFSDDGKKETVLLKLDKPGVYTGSFKDIENGVHIVRIVETIDDGTTYEETTALSVNYSSEYNLTNQNSINKKLVEAVNGKIIDNPLDVFKFINENIKSQRDITDILIILSILIFIVDIALRKFNISIKFKKKKKESIVEEEISEEEIIEDKLVSKTIIKEKKSTIHEETKLNTNRLLKAKNRRK